MPLTNSIAEMTPEVTKWRQYLHTIPELAFDLPKTSAFVQEKLAEFGVDEIHTGYAQTGVVAVIKAGNSSKTIGLRADMDALPMEEMADVPYKSTHAGAMHACGHDSHTSMLLGAAKYLSETRNFDGTVYLYFQPGEEGHAGARVMMEEGLFDKFPPDEVYAMHNWPNLGLGEFSVTTGAFMAAGGRFILDIKGKGGHAAHPNQCIDPVMIGTQIVQAWQTLVSRVCDPLDHAVVSVTKFHAGTAFNVIPDTAHLGGTVRTVNGDTSATLYKMMQDTADNIAGAYGATVDLDIDPGYPALINHEIQSQYARDVCANIVGADNVTSLPPTMGGEDFAFMLQEVPGCYVILGIGDGKYVHDPEYVFNDDALAYGIDFFVQMTESRLAK